MRRAQLARNLAVSMVSGAWQAATLEQRLAHRLPARLQTLSSPLAHHTLTAFPQNYAPAASKLAAALPLAPEFETLFLYCQKHDAWPLPELRAPDMAPIDAFASLDLPALATPRALTDWLALPLDRLDWFADPQGRAEEHGETAINHYFYTLSPKKSGGLRVIEAPKPALKALQRRILRGILDRVPVHDAAFGFRRGRSCLQSAARHAGEAVVLRFDLADFFASVQAGRIHALFRCLGYPEAVARALTGLTTNRVPGRVCARLGADARALYRETHLPQGAPSSPALANLVAFTLDRRLSGLARSLDAQYSRYADDLAFSGDARIATVLMRSVPQILREEGFALRPEKTARMPASGRQMLTGLIVNRKLNTSRKEFDRLKAILHACRRPEDDRLDDPGFRLSLEGRIAWVEAVNPGRGRKLRAGFETALGRRRPAQ